MKGSAQEALLTTSSIHDDRRKERHSDPHSKWKTTVSVGTALAMIVLVANVVLLAWVRSVFTILDGNATVFEGPFPIPVGWETGE